MGKQSTSTNSSADLATTAAAPARASTQPTRAAASSTEVAGPDSSVPGLNHCLLIGEFAAEPDMRTLPSGTVAASFSIRVRSRGARAASVPVVWYDPPKRLARWKLDEHVLIRGSVVRRFYRGAGGLGSSTEVVVDSAELLRHPAKVAPLLKRAVDEVQDLLSLGDRPASSAGE